MMAIQTMIMLRLAQDLVQIVIFTCVRINQLSSYNLDICMSLALQFYLIMDHSTKEVEVFQVTGSHREQQLPHQKRSKPILNPTNHTTQQIFRGHQQINHHKTGVSSTCKIGDTASRV